jgi:CheY-like chemotaxis protein/HPt (histidine-containing phosphotransfer) domain-containing protein
MEAGKMELETIEFNLLELVEGCVELLSSTARDKGLALFTFVDPKIPKIVQGDPVRLRQVLLNLTSNAIKFTSSGKVIVEAQTIKPALDGEVKLRFSVTDTGCGLTKEARALLFQPFIQADGSTTRKYGGTGLGLSISKRLVEMMNGSIGVESEFGKGSKFFFSASLQCGNTEAPLLDPEIKLALQNKRILLMDENKCLSLVAKPYLEASDVITTAACDPQTVVFMLKRALLQNIPFHLLIVDYEKHFDAKNSFVLNAAISSANDSKTPMIFLINFDEEDQIAKFSKKGSSAAYLIKPIRQNSFYRLVAKMLSQPTYFSEHPSFKSKTEELKKFSIEEEPHERSGDEVNSNGSEKIETEMGKKIVFVESQVAELETNKKQRTHALVMGKRIKILLAEDNITMQKLGVQQLSKLGFDVTAVGNGSDILKALKNENFCMILMDCQMPIIDGFETTKIIRQNEKTTGEHIPIVALTASAMDGDKEICYAAGMDDYLSKPVDQQQLKLIIQKWCEKKNEQSQSPDLKDIEPILQIDGAKDNSADNPFDIQQLILLYGGENIAEILRSFVSEGREILSQIQKSLSKKDIESLTAEAHSLKGMAMVLTAHQMAEVSLALEQAAKNAAFEKVASHLSILEQSLLSAQAFIASVVDETEKNSLNSNLQAENLQV